MMSIQPLKVAYNHKEHSFKLWFTVYEVCFPNVTPHHLKQGQVALPNIVVVDFDVDPAGILCGFMDRHAVAPVVHLCEEETLLWGGVDAAVKLSSKQVNSHYAEDEPEDQTHQQHIEDGGNRTNKSIDHDLPSKENSFIKKNNLETVSVMLSHWVFLPLFWPV